MPRALFRRKAINKRGTSVIAVTRVGRTELNVARYKSSRRNMRARDTCLILSIAYQHCVGVSCRLDTRVWKSSLLHAGALAWSARDRIATPREDTLCRSGGGRGGEWREDGYSLRALSRRFYGEKRAWHATDEFLIDYSHALRER